MGISKMARTSKTKMLVACAVCIALAFALNQVSLFRMPQGGSITPFSMFFVTLAGYWFGPAWGILSGISMGLLDMSTGFRSVHIGSIILDYPLAFGALGLAGFFRKRKFGLQIGFVVGVLGRFVSVYLSGYFFWLERAPGSEWASAVYNATYIAPEMLATLFIISLPSMKHAIDEVTKNVVSPSEYAMLSDKNKGSVSVNARIITGAAFGALGGFAFIVAAYIRRIEELVIVQLTTGAQIFTENGPLQIFEFFESPARRIPRFLVGDADTIGNTGQIFALQTVGVILFAISVALLFSVLAKKSD